MAEGSEGRPLAPAAGKEAAGRAATKTDSGRAASRASRARVTRTARRARRPPPPDAWSRARGAPLSGWRLGRLALMEPPRGPPPPFRRRAWTRSPRSRSRQGKGRHGRAGFLQLDKALASSWLRTPSWSTAMWAAVAAFLRLRVTGKGPALPPAGGGVSRGGGGGGRIPHWDPAPVCALSGRAGCGRGERSRCAVPACGTLGPGGACPGTSTPWCWSGSAFPSPG